MTDALLAGKEPPPQFAAAMQKIAVTAKSKGCRIWIDAEQQALQKAIDIWTMNLQRKFNTGSDVLIYNTVQAYLKQSRPKLKHQLEVAKQEGWNLAVKLVRGAYIENDKRELIHDTKAETDASYNGIVHDLLTGKFEGFTPETFPRMKLFLAGHNSETIGAALKLGKELGLKGELNVCPEFGQLQGMADDIGCEIIQFGEILHAERTEKRGLVSRTGEFEPRAYKCLTWGTIQECMQYLVRRAIENSAAVGRMKECAAEARRELGQRFSFRTRPSPGQAPVERT